VVFLRVSSAAFGFLTKLSGARISVNLMVWNGNGRSVRDVGFLVQLNVKDQVHKGNSVVFNEYIDKALDGIVDIDMSQAR